VVIGASIVSAATATEVGASGVKRQPWANAPFIPGALADYMKAQFEFFNSAKFADGGRPILAGLNYFLTRAPRRRGQEAAGREARREGLADLALPVRPRARSRPSRPPSASSRSTRTSRSCSPIIGKEYPKDLYDMQFSIYCDKILARIDLQREAFGKERTSPRSCSRSTPSGRRASAP
jgi:phosphoenolpyruvate carboxykinase (GTP)